MPLMGKTQFGFKKSNKYNPGLIRELLSSTLVELLPQQYKGHRLLMTESNDNPQIKQLSAYLRVHNAEAAIVFYKDLFGAIEVFRLAEPNDRVAHAELQFGSTVVMISDEYPEMGVMSPTSLDGSGVGIYLQVEDVNELYERAIKAGATSINEPEDQFYGDRSAKIRDPYGHEWLLSQQIEKLSAVEMQDRFDKFLEK